MEIQETFQTKDLDASSRIEKNLALRFTDFLAPGFSLRWFNERTRQDIKSYNRLQKLRHDIQGGILLDYPVYLATGIIYGLAEYLL
ncbi:hypothetical protein HYT25_02015 [Candidatus Pacearchaeota archaeon]|nr:hypothetical protein [Candidatus Pacearchaeota archaeon]